MWAFIKKVFQPIRDFLVRHVVIIFLLLGFGLILLALFIQDSFPKWYQPIISAGVGVISGSSVTAVIRSKHFLDIFTEIMKGIIYHDDHLKKQTDGIRAAIRETETLEVQVNAVKKLLNDEEYFDKHGRQIRSIVYAEEFLEERSDILNLWSNVSKALYKRKFPSITGDLHDQITSIYFPTNQNSFLEEFTYEMTIEYLGDDFIKLEEIERAVHVSSGIDVTVNFDFNVWIELPTENHSEQFTTEYRLTEFIINNESVDCSSLVTKDNGSRDGIYFDKYGFVYGATGKKKYSVIKKEEKIYSLRANPFKKFTFKQYCRKFVLDVTFNTEQFDLRFTEMGTMSPFKDVPGIETNGRLRKENVKLLLPNQGFMLVYNQMV